MTPEVASTVCFLLGSLAVWVLVAAWNAFNNGGAHHVQVEIELTVKDERE